MKLEQLLMAMDSDLFERLQIEVETDISKICMMENKVIYSSDCERSAIKDYLDYCVSYFNIVDDVLVVVVRGLRLI